MTFAAEIVSLNDVRIIVVGTGPSVCSGKMLTVEFVSDIGLFWGSQRRSDGKMIVRLE